ncbi:hypothetical protein BKA62DRAFT_709860 [Auriculariales sp. MPI-PUGE-AT-0066]|nr:hypothetical protein BKA62DRAFT_709860 [Auriculariales sp. MPI-PUGE-AT-0066]
MSLVYPLTSALSANALTAMPALLRALRPRRRPKTSFQTRNSSLDDLLLARRVMVVWPQAQELRLVKSALTLLCVHLLVLSPSSYPIIGKSPICQYCTTTPRNWDIRSAGEMCNFAIVDGWQLCSSMELLFATELLRANGMRARTPRGRLWITSARIPARSPADVRWAEQDRQSSYRPRVPVASYSPLAANYSTATRPSGWTMTRRGLYRFLPCKRPRLLDAITRPAIGTQTISYSLLNYWLT